MPIAYVIDENKNRVVTTAAGPISNDDLVRYATKLHNDPAVKPGMTELRDLSGLEPGEINVSSDGIRALVEFEEPYLDAGLDRRIAVFAPDDLQFGMTRIYQNYVEIAQQDSTLEFKIFRDKDEAEAWLDRPTA